MTGGTAAGMMLSDIFSGRDNPKGELFDPFKRVSAKGARKSFEQNVNVGGWYGRNWARRLAIRKRPEDLEAGEASYVKTSSGAAAAYRDEYGELHMVTPACTHLRCAVSWNEAEKSWDCPCHGSRFNVDGQVLHPPAKSALPPADG